MEAAAPPKKSSNKLTAMLNFEQEMQTKWEQEKCFEKNAEDQNRFQNSLLLVFFQVLFELLRSNSQEKSIWSRFRILT
jgi:hypothetical protein